MTIYPPRLAPQTPPRATSCGCGSCTRRAACCSTSRPCCSDRCPPAATGPWPMGHSPHYRLPHLLSTLPLRWLAMIGYSSCPLLMHEFRMRHQAIGGVSMAAAGATAPVTVVAPVSHSHVGRTRGAAGGTR
jgi:hypothetical protein